MDVFVRAVDSAGYTIDFLLRKNRDASAAKAFFRKAIKHNGQPQTVTIDKSGSNSCALNNLNESLAKDKQIEIRQIKYLNNIVEQDHRFIKKELSQCLVLKALTLPKLQLQALKILG